MINVFVFTVLENSNRIKCILEQGCREGSLCMTQKACQLLLSSLSHLSNLNFKSKIRDKEQKEAIFYYCTKNGDF